MTSIGTSVVSGLTAARAGAKGRPTGPGRSGGTPMRVAVVTLTAVIVAMLLPGVATAATCADYPNQAAAQRAADTRDADGDGIYCESLPCPCLKPGGSAPPPPPAPPPPAATCSRPSTVQLLR